MERQAIILKHRAKKRMYAEYETSEPRLGRVLGHCAVYHFASYIIETEELIAARLEERCYDEEDQGWSSSSSEDEEEPGELDQSDNVAHAATPVLQAVDCAALKQDDGMTNLCDDIEMVSLQEAYCETIVPVKQPRQVIRTKPKNSSLPNPLASHPPDPEQSQGRRVDHVEESGLSTVIETPDEYMEKMVLKLARTMYKILVNLNPKSPWMAALEEGDLEAQKWLEEAIFAMTPSQEWTSSKYKNESESTAWTVCRPNQMTLLG